MTTNPDERLESVMVAELERRRDTFAAMTRAAQESYEALELAQSVAAAGHEAVQVARAEVMAMCNALATLGYPIPEADAGPQPEYEDG